MSRSPGEHDLKLVAKNCMSWAGGKGSTQGWDDNKLLSTVMGDSRVSLSGKGRLRVLNGQVTRVGSTKRLLVSPRPCKLPSHTTLLQACCTSPPTSRHNECPLLPAT
jgi:hypothetical protein